VEKAEGFGSNRRCESVEVVVVVVVVEGGGEKEGHSSQIWQW